ncbi:MAG: hypothetical protein JWM36_2833 [Hyphomicrobiales bacterium]|nr:hypothetical protein [Hyphomicrobiales bacterium]
MQLGVIGLGRMGGNMVRRLLAEPSHSVVVYDRSPTAAQALGLERVRAAADLSELVVALAPPRAIWIMLPAGDPTEQTVAQLAALLVKGDVIIDGGNSFWQDDVRRAAMLRERGLHYVDVGTSGGIWGLERGYCMMIGGEPAVIKHLDPLLATLAPGPGDIPQTPGRKGRDSRVERGYLHAGPSGAGHFVKMIHNGIEYGLMQAYAEGIEILKNAGSTDLPQGHRFDFDVADVAEVWRRGSVISSWLLDLTSSALARSPALEGYLGRVADSGEGRWTVNAAIDEAVAAPVLTAALYARFRSRREHTFADRLLSAMRDAFGGHKEPPA